VSPDDLRRALPPMLSPPNRSTTHLLIGMGEEGRSEKIAFLFQEAVEIATPTERAAFLANACAGDPDLYREIETLLRAHESAGSFLAGNSLFEHGDRPEHAQASGVDPGDRLGPYQLLGRIGEGASSTVYLAEQEQPVRRWVALKVIKAGMDTRQVIARFELERQALAVMDHPGIAKVLDAGATPNGRPFFVMELVRGPEITRHCDQCQLDLKQRLELFIQVCQAVLHAHQKGIVHRDIKPDNILVCSHDGCVSPKIIDFGIAKVLHNQSLGGTPMTRGLPFLGTPAYMSPEQAQGATADLDTRTDIYSLGALLYELLVGHPPFDHQKLVAAGLNDMCRIIRSEEPLAASQRFAQLPAEEQSAIAEARATSPEQLRRDLSGDLDWICLKALEKDREQRYDTAAGLAQDVRRHLVNLPVSAAAPTLPYRFKKIMRRNRTIVMTAAAFILLLLVGTVATGIMAVHADSSARRAAKLQSAAMAAERQSHNAVLEMHASSALSASEIGNYDRAVLGLPPLHAPAAKILLPINSTLDEPWPGWPEPRFPWRPSNFHRPLTSWSSAPIRNTCSAWIARAVASFGIVPLTTNYPGLLAWAASWPSPGIPTAPGLLWRLKTNQSS
jgi:eukaryotic-like serine/threonine-protein kinase